MTKHEMSFAFFVTLWNRVLGQTTPDVHLDIADWLSERTAAGDDRLLLMAFRGCGKSTIVGLYIAWTLYRNPDMRILVVSADEQLSGRMVRHVRRVIERHPFTRHLIPDAPDQWAADRFTVKRSAEWRDPSVVACGLFGNVTGMRADLIICDDVEVPGTSDSASKRDDLRARLQELVYVRAAGARSLYVGTPHAFDTIYATEPRVDVPGHAPFLAGYTALTIPVLDGRGRSRWPEKYPVDDLEKLKKSTGFTRFQSQMMLVPLNPEQSYFDPAQMNVYDDDLVFVREIGELYLGDRKLVSCSAFWDPALARGSGDSSVLAVVFTDSRGDLFIHRVAYLRVDPNNPEDDAAQQGAQVAAILKELQVPVVGVEINGLGRFLPPILRREIVRARAGTAVIEISSCVPKNTRILQAFEAPLAARMMHAHVSVLHTPFMDELRDFRPGLLHQNDDGIDAVAGAIAMEPVRIDVPRGSSYCRPAWRMTKPHFARTT